MSIPEAVATAAEGNGAQSVDRAITVLEIIARRGEASVSEVASEVGVHRSTISRLLGVLESRGMVELAGARGRYRLGPNILRLAGAMTSPLDIAHQGATIAEELATELGETVNIAVLRGDYAVNVFQAVGAGLIAVNNWVGRPTPLHATSSGKVLLAALGEADAVAILRLGLQSFTAATVTDIGELSRQLATARRAGFAVTCGELEVGLNAIAVPVRGADGTVIAALSVSAPDYRLPAEQLASHAQWLAAPADRIARLMGFRG
ncbi:MAG: IclR family transcriptional regulator [Microbacteriaceae bacterium]|nr:IclR family transcriptional regulator [Microbacteriaceae bacterium]